jgi:SNF2 family DNA or RNA helicase
MTYGTILLHGSTYIIEAAPHVRSRLRRVFVAADHQTGHRITIGDTLSNAEDLTWFLERYPLKEAVDGTLDHLRQRASDSRRMREECEALLQSGDARMPVDTRLPLRDYQLLGVEMLHLRRRLLVGDDLGLGKTAVALGAIASGLLPAIVVCQTHLQRQWVNEAAKFLRGVYPHIVKKGQPYRLPTHNLLILPYSKLAGWKDALKGYKFIAFDEVQELRHPDSMKYVAATTLAASCEYTLGLSATPIYNYGDEIFHVLDVINPGCLGTKGEFLREWCRGIGSFNNMVNDPKALGTWIQDNHLMLRRHRRDVSKELPAITRITQEVEHDARKVKELGQKGAQLAHAVLNGSFTERGQAARELDSLMRQQTSIAKAPQVAEAVVDLVRNGEKIVLLGWHREVYAIWQNVFEQNDIKAVLYTGSESTNQKDAAVDAFTEGEAKIFIMSLRSGAGLNGLQNVCSMMVVGELDWSPQVIEQCIGRLNRDGQQEPVTVVFLVTSAGSDPLIANILGLKREQSDGIVNPEEETETLTQQVIESRGAALARSILQPKTLLPS